MINKALDINADLGEGAGYDEQLIPLISSCNIASGGHAGDEQSISEVVSLAKENGVKIGAHPSYPDKVNFGREVMEIKEIDLQSSLEKQVASFYEVATKNNVEVHHIKAHGALYNQIAKDEKTAELYLRAILRLGVTPTLYVPPESVIYNLAKGRFSIKTEAFIDRAYNKDLSLVSRKTPDSLHKTPERAWNQLYEMITLGEVSTLNGDKVAIEAQTYCIHGDHPNSLEILKFIHTQLQANKISVQ